eukprot:Em0051g14a
MAKELQQERSQSSLNIEEVTNMLDGGRSNTDKRRQLWNSVRGTVFPRELGPGRTVFPKGIRSAGPKIGPDRIPYDTGYDGLSYHNGMKFTTLDHDNENWGANCASQNSRGGFWYNACYSVNPNGEYNSYLYWYPLGNIRFDEMKIRRN